ncbi:MAG: NUDIX domain-containing protein [Candidatus Woesearchaeota archaeon]
MALPTRAVKAVIVKDYEVLLLQRNPATRGVDNWDLPGGLVEEGEDEVESLLRELREELGVDAEVLERSGSWRFFRPKDGQWVEVWNYACRLLSDNIRLSDEHVGFDWVSPERLRSFPVKDASFYDVLEEWFQKASSSSSL